MLNTLPTLLACLLAASSPALAQPPGGSGGGGVTIIEPPPSAKPNSPRSSEKDRTTPPRSSASGEEIDLRPKFIPGHTTRYEFVLDHDYASTPANTANRNDETPTASKLGQRMKIALHTIESSETSALVELTIESVDLALEANGMTLRMSSDPSAQPAPSASKLSEEEEAASDILATVARSIAGTKLQLVLDERGNITSVRGGESLGMTSMMAQLVGGGGGAVGGSAGSGLAGGLLPTANANGSSAGLQWLISGASGQPARARVGQTWTNNDKLGSSPIGDLQMVTRHTVRSIRNDLAEIAFVGQLEPTSVGSSPANNSGKVRQSDYRGTYTWDAKAGELGRMSAEMRSELETSAAAGASATKVKSTTRMTAERLGSSVTK